MKPRRSLAKLRALLATSLTSASAFGGTYTWVGSTSAAWGDPANWNISTTPPVSTDTFPVPGSTYASDNLRINNWAYVGDQVEVYQGAVYDPGVGVTTTFSNGRGIVIGVGNGPSATPANVRGSASLTIASGSIVLNRAGAGSGNEPYMSNRSDATLTLSGGNLDLSNTNGLEFRLIQEGFPGITSTITVNSGTLTCNLLNLMFDTTGELESDRFGTGIINLNGGVLALNRFNITAPAPSGQASFTINLNGGTLKARNTNANFLNDLLDTKVYVKSGGAIIDTNTFTTTIAAPLLHDPALGETPDGGITKLNTAGTLILTSTASTYTGGTFINTGTLTVSHDGSLGAPTGGITFNGTSNLNIGATIAASNRVITVNSGVNANIQLAVGVQYVNSGKVTGPGNLGVRATGSGASRSAVFASPANDFTGKLSIDNQNSDQTISVTLSSLSDPVGAGNLAYTNFNNAFPAFIWAADATSGLTLTNRRIELGGTMGTTGTASINNSNATYPVVIESDLLVSGNAGARRLVLAGVAGPVNVFAGNIADGTDSPVTVTKGNNASVWTLSGDNSFTGGVTLNGATAGSQLNVASPTAFGTGTFLIGGGGLGRLDNTSGAALTLTTNNPQSWTQNFTFVGTHALNLGTGAVTLGGTRDVTVSGSTLTIGGVIGAATTTIGLTKMGNGVLELTAANTYEGPTKVSFGTLLLTGSGSLHANSAVTLDNYGTLAGTGTVHGSVTATANSSLSPGVGAGVLTIGGGLDLAGMAAGTFGQLHLELGALAATSDRINVGGTLALGDGVFGLNDVNLINLGGVQPGTYTLVSAAAITGTLDGTNLTGTLGAYDTALQLSGGNLQLVVSEPVVSAPSFTGWISGYSVGTQTALGDDPDADGIANGLEYLFGTNPGVASAGLVAKSFNGTTFIFTRPKNAALGTDVTARYRWTKDLVTNRYHGESDTGTTVTFTTQPDTPTTGMTTVTATLTGTATARFFVAVEVATAAN